MSIDQHSQRGLLLLPVLLLTLLLMGAVMPAQARSWNTNAVHLAQVDGAGAARIVQRQTGGKVLSVDQHEKKGRVFYRVKVLLPEGRVRTVNVDAETGRMSG